MFEGFGLSFMTGAAVFGVINLAAMVATLVLCFVLWILVVVYRNDWTFTLSDLKPIVFAAIASALVVIFLIPFTVIQPKVSITVPESPALVEFKETPREVIINTPPPRTEKLEGFRPLFSE